MRGGRLAVPSKPSWSDGFCVLPDNAGAPPLQIGMLGAFHLVDLTDDPVRYVCNFSGSWFTDHRNRGRMMSDYKDADFKERLSAAAQAKRAMLERFRAKADDPAALEREAARRAVSEAREQRHAERKAAREAEAAQKKADAERHAAETAEREAREKAEKEARELSLEAERKAARDARYAARKKRK
jgi:hypothetical protein